MKISYIKNEPKKKKRKRQKGTNQRELISSSRLEFLYLFVFAGRKRGLKVGGWIGQDEITPDYGIDLVSRWRS